MLILSCFNVVGYDITCPATIFILSVHYKVIMKHTYRIKVSWSIGCKRPRLSQIWYRWLTDNFIDSNTFIIKIWERIMSPDSHLNEIMKVVDNLNVTTWRTKFANIKTTCFRKEENVHIEFWDLYKYDSLQDNSNRSSYRIISIKEKIMIY
jgi:hypothetical protein